MESTKAVTEAKFELAKAKEALRMLESQASAVLSAIPSAMGDRDLVQQELVTMSAKLQIAKVASTATFDYLKRTVQWPEGGRRCNTGANEVQIVGLHSDSIRPSNSKHRGVSAECRWRYIVIVDGIELSY